MRSTYRQRPRVGCSEQRRGTRSAGGAPRSGTNPALVGTCACICRGRQTLRRRPALHFARQQRADARSTKQLTLMCLLLERTECIAGGLWHLPAGEVVLNELLPQPAISSPAVSKLQRRPKNAGRATFLDCLVLGLFLRWSSRASFFSASRRAASSSAVLPWRARRNGVVRGACTRAPASKHVRWQHLKVPRMHVKSRVLCTGCCVAGV